MTSSTILNVMIYATLACFPLLMLATLVVAFAKKRGVAFLQANSDAKRAYDRIVAAGPKEGWSGYVILALVLLWLALMAGLVLTSVQSGDPNPRSSIDRAEMVRVEMDGGGYGYVPMEKMDDAVSELLQFNRVPDEILIPVCSKDGKVIGEHTVNVKAVSKGEQKGGFSRSEG